MNIGHSVMSNSLRPHGLGFSVHGILQARIVEWVAVPSSRASSRPRDQTVSCIAGGFFTSWAINVNTSSLMKDDFISREGIRDTRWQPLWVMQEAAPLPPGCSPARAWLYLLGGLQPMQGVGGPPIINSYSYLNFESSPTGKTVFSLHTQIF